MDVMKLSQKQKISIFIVVLCCGFLLMSLFIAQKLSSMTLHYQQSSEIAQGEITLLSTQTKLLSLAAERDNIQIKDIPRITDKLKTLIQDVSQDVKFLQGMNLGEESKVVLDAMTHFDRGMRPLLDIKSELGFNINEGKLGILSKLAQKIEAKIEETGMVTIRSDFRAMIKAQQNYLLSPNEQNLKLFNRAMAMFINTSKSYSTFNSYQEEVGQYKHTFLRVSELSKKAKNLESELSASEKSAQESIRVVSKKMMSISQAYQQKAYGESAQTTWSVLAACAILAVITIAIFLTLSISLSRSLAQTKRVLEGIAKGDLSKRVTISDNPRDEFNQLAVAINNSCEHLGILVQKVQQSSQYLSGDAANLNHGLDQLVASQLGVIQQTDRLASATEQVSVTTQEVSHSLEFVADVSKASTVAAQEGSDIIETAIQSLEDVSHILASAATHIQQLEQASEKVDSVMDIINGIAEQTNLLALNAAIEAARAGEQGRGFAVVADEVRNLAVRTVNAVAEISETIETMKRESAEVIQYISQSESSMKVGQERGIKAMQALSHITEKASEAANQTETIFASMKELATTSHSMAESMIQISETMKNLEGNNEKLRETSQIVDQRSSGLSTDCQQFSI